jgi:predicted DCC family thiol-disulfide oxidoreductase YuxK
MNARTPTLVVLYDANCALWRREINRFEATRAQAASGQTYRLKLVDIRSPYFRASAYGFGVDMLEGALHMRDQQGLWHSGYAAMRCLYQQVHAGKSQAAIAPQKSALLARLAQNPLDSACANDECLQLSSAPSSGKVC